MMDIGSRVGGTHMAATPTNEGAEIRGKLDVVQINGSIGDIWVRIFVMSLFLIVLLFLSLANLGSNLVGQGSALIGSSGSW